MGNWPTTYPWAIAATNWLMSHALFLFVAVNTVHAEMIYLLEFLVERTCDEYRGRGTSEKALFFPTVHLKDSVHQNKYIHFLLYLF